MGQPPPERRATRLRDELNVDSSSPLFEVIHLINTRIVRPYKVWLPLY
jgi:hypothetical protein